MKKDNHPDSTGPISDSGVGYRRAKIQGSTWRTGESSAVPGKYDGTGHVMPRVDVDSEFYRSSVVKVRKYKQK